MSRIAEIVPVVERQRPILEAIPGVVRARPGYWLTHEDGVTDEPVIVVKLDPSSRFSRAALDLIPPQLDGVRVRIAVATPQDVREAAVEHEPTAGASIQDSRSTLDELALPGTTETESNAPSVTMVEELRDPYDPPKEIPLDIVDEPTRVVCHTSPDAGWPTLSTFFAGVEDRITVGMYDFTAEHIVAGLRNGMAEARGDLVLVLDPKVALTGDTKEDDWPEEMVRDDLAKALQSRFTFRWAAVPFKGRTTGGIFKDSYHIKVAVRDGQVLWLSSGNWQSSNQPATNPLQGEPEPKLHQRYNREWHVVVENTRLANIYERYLQHDAEEAVKYQEEEGVPEVLLTAPPTIAVDLEALDVRGKAAPEFFAPIIVNRTLRIQPLLTPDNFAPHVLKLIQSATKRLYFQNQYIKITKRRIVDFLTLVDALSERAAHDVDVRVILRDAPGTGDMLEALKEHGFDMSVVRVQRNCHNKGIIVDSSTVLIGSHNWSAAGTLGNRDASLVIYDEEIAKFYEKIFLHDWDRLARRAPITDEAALSALGVADDLTAPRLAREAWTMFAD